MCFCVYVWLFVLLVDLLMQYCLNISFYLMLKSQEKGVKDHPVIEELVRIRTLFEKLSPIELKLKPKLNKLFKNVSDPSFSLTSLYKSTAAAVAADEEKEEEIEEGEGEEEGDGSGVDLGFDLEAMVGQKEPKAKKSSSKKPSIKSFVAKKYSSGSRSSAVKAGSGKLVDETGEREEYYANSDDEEKATFDVDKKRALTQTINDIAQVSHESGQLRRKRMLSGDQDFLPQQAKQNKKQKVDISAFAKMGAGSDGEEEEEEAEKEEEHKGPSKSSLKGRRRREKARIEKGLKILAEDNLEEGAKRDISRRIEKNRGLIRSRSSAHGTTPHSRVRAKFQKKLRSGSGVMPAKRDNSKPFTGEKNGIKPYIVRSTKF